MADTDKMDFQFQSAVTDLTTEEKYRPWEGIHRNAVQRRAGQQGGAKNLEQREPKHRRVEVTIPVEEKCGMLRLGWLIFLLLVSNGLASPLSLLDSSFAVGTGADGFVSTLFLQPDQRILLGGGFTAINGQTSPYLNR